MSEFRTRDTRETWRHALRYLDNVAARSPKVDRDDLFSVTDLTGIFEKEGKNLQRLYKDRKMDTVETFSQIVQLLLKREADECEEGFNEAFNVHKIEGYQYLTTR